MKPLSTPIELNTMSMPSEVEMRNAIAARDKSYNGEFYYGVITTGVFCQPSCTSRAAKAENLRFFPDIKAAMANGFRSCKRCQPSKCQPQVDRLIEVASYIEKHAEERLTLANLATLAGMSSSRLQRIFKKAFGISPKVYQDAVRMRLFKKSLQQGENVTDAIFSSGYGSISRVYGEAARNIGMKPKAYRAKGAGESITYAIRHTQLGWVMMAATEKGVCFVQFADEKEYLLPLLEAEFSKAKLQASPAQDTPELDLWMDALAEHINGALPRPELPLDMRGTAFQMKVWLFLLSIREGDVLSYGEVAAEIDKPKAVRAVASACAKNRIGVLIPCHRVLRGDGNLGGYRWGLERKRTLLKTEKQRQAN